MSKRAQQEPEELQLDTISPEEQELIDEALGYYRNEHVEALKTAWLLGKCVEKSENVSVYGSGFIKKMAQAIAVKPQYLYKRRAMAEIFSEPELDKLCHMRTRLGVPLTFSHIEQTFPFKDHKKRWAVLEAACEENWTYDQLRAAIKSSGAEGKARNKGPKIKTPDTVDEQLIQVNEMLPRWQDRIKAWTDETGGFLALLANLPAARYSESWVPRFQVLAASARSLRESLDTLSEQAEEAAQHIKELICPARDNNEGVSEGSKSPELFNVMPALDDEMLFAAEGE